MTNQDALYAAAASQFGLIVRGSAQELRSVLNKLVRTDAGLIDLTVLGPDNGGLVWLVRQGACHVAQATEDRGQRTEDRGEPNDPEDRGEPNDPE